LVALFDDRIGLDLKDLRAGPPRALDYADIIEALLARAELEGKGAQSPSLNLSAVCCNEFLHRRLTVEDAVRAHPLSLKGARDVGFGILVVTAPSPFV
jgi:hypothetical protein